MCTLCNYNENYYPILEENQNDFFDCFNIEPDGYYLDNINNIYKPCFIECYNNNQLENENLSNNCISNYSISNFQHCYKNCKYNYDKCYIKDRAYINSNIPIINTFLNKTIYSYNINNKELKDIYTNITYIEISQEIINYLNTKYNLNEETDVIYASIIDYPSDGEKTAINDYDYKFYLENGIELYIDEDYYVDIFVPIKNLDLANYNYSKIFAEQGYDIYDKESDFYNDICSPANLGENDIILKDRKKDIYPNDVILCKDNCYYNGINMETERFICSCNLNMNNDNEKIDNTTDDFLKEDNGNFISYFLDNINYKIFKCYNLLIIFNNLKKNYAFYTILGVFFVIIIMNHVFIFYILSNIKNRMLVNSPTSESIKHETIKFLKTFKKMSENTKLNPPKKKKKKSKKKRKKIIRNTNNIIITNNIKKQTPSNINLIDNNNSNNIDLNTAEITDDDEINNFPYTKALIKDKRNIYKIFKCILFEKLELIHVLFGENTIKLILINEYILSLLINFFFNTLLYSDEVISNKYHNNGELDFIVTLILSLLSNIITSIICFYIKYSKGIEERFEFISEIKYQEHYIRNVNKYFRYLKIKFIFFFLSEIIIISSCFYYVNIFCIVYSFSKISLLINYLTSLLEGLITSIIVTIIIVFMRVTGLKCHINTFYNTSKYLNNKF